MRRRRKHMLQTKFFYVASVFACSFGVVSFLWRYSEVHWLFVAFGLGWVAVVTAFAWEIVGRAQRLDAQVKNRTRELEQANRDLASIMEQISVFHRISHDMNRSGAAGEILRTFAEKTQQMSPPIDSVWLWLDRQWLGLERGGEETEEGEQQLVLAAVAGNDMGRPDELAHSGLSNPLIAKPYQSRALCVMEILPERTEPWGGTWLRESGSRFFAGLPLLLRQDTPGVVGVFSREPMSLEFLLHLELNVNQLAAALERIRLLAQLQKHARQLAAANAELQRLDSAKNWFLSTVSHELRTPLTSIRSLAEILQTYDVSAAERVEFAGIIKDESDRLGSLLNSILDAERIKNGTMDWQIESADPTELIKRACKLFRHRAESQGLTLHYSVAEGLPAVLADRDRTLTVLNNLLSNALKYTPSGGTVRVRAERVEQDEGREFVRIAVADNGVGVSATERDRIFEKFARSGNPVSEAPPGLGLGLAISKQIVEHLGGRIWVESEADVGSTFYLTLPVAAQGQNRQRRAKAS